MHGQYSAQNTRFKFPIYAICRRHHDNLCMWGSSACYNYGQMGHIDVQLHGLILNQATNKQTQI